MCYWINNTSDFFLTNLDDIYLTGCKNKGLWYAEHIHVETNEKSNQFLNYQNSPNHKANVSKVVELILNTFK